MKDVIDMLTHQDLVDRCVLFFEEHPEFGTPDGATAACYKASMLFCEQFPELDTSLLHVIGYETKLPNRHVYWDEDGYPNPDPSFYHVVVLVDGSLVVDVTYLQLDTLWPQPYRIMKLAEFQKIWLAPSMELISGPSYWEPRPQRWIGYK